MKMILHQISDKAKLKTLEVVKNCDIKAQGRTILALS